MAASGLTNIYFQRLRKTFQDLDLGVEFVGGGTTGNNEFSVHRNRYNARDSINAFLNYGNTILYSYIMKRIYSSNLLQEVGFLHHLHEKKYPSVYDLTEPYRPIIDWCVLALASEIIKEHYYRDRILVSVNHAVCEEHIEYAYRTVPRT